VTSIYSLKELIFHIMHFHHAQKTFQHILEFSPTKAAQAPYETL